MTKSRFPKTVVDELLAKSGRRCCLCHEFKGGKVEVHHIVPGAQRGTGTAGNAIVLCFDCHADIHAYWEKNPRGRKFTPPELRRHRDGWFQTYARTGASQIDYKQLAGELLQQYVGQARPPEGATDIGTEELAKAAGPDTEARLREALELQDQNREREAIECLYEAFRRDLEPRAKAQLHGLIGNSFFKLSELEEAEGHYCQALDASRAGNIAEYEAASLGNLGLVHAVRGDLQRAEAHHLQALAIDREMGNRLPEAQDLNNLGIVYRRDGDLDRAAEHHEQSLTTYRQMGNRVGEANALMGLGLIYEHKDDLERAEEHYKVSLTVYREMEERPGEAAALGNLGKVYTRRGDRDHAQEALAQAVAISREVGNRLNEASCLANLGLLAAKSRDKEKACLLLKQAASIFEEIGAAGELDRARGWLRGLGCE